MSRDTGAPTGAPRRLDESNAPCFRKRLTSAMLKRAEKMEIPKKFVREHCDKFRRVLSLTGPNGESRSVTLVVRGARSRVYLRRGWMGFARECGFRSGNEVIFWLVARASFHVALCSSQSLEKATSTRVNSSEGDEAGGTSAAITSEIAPQPKLARQDLASDTNHEEIQIPPCHVDSNIVETQEGIKSRAQFCDTGASRRVNESNAPYVRKRLTSAMPKQSQKMEIPKKFVHEHGGKNHRVLSEAGGTRDAMTSELRHQQRPQVPTGCVEAVPPQKRSSNVLEEEFVKYPGLNEAVIENSRFPQFVKRLTACNLNCEKITGPEFPGAFVEEHGDEVHEHVTLLGASDHLRRLKLRITKFAGCGRVFLGQGWRNFSLENGYCEGDVLLFSLVGTSTFVVKTFPGARRSGG